MITYAECKSRITECQTLGLDPAILARRATAVMAVCLAWTALALAVAEYDAVVKDEARELN